MHYYQFNIGDYAKSTKHLTLFEDLAYRRLLDLAYDTEKPLPKDIDKLTRLIGMREQKTETQQVLEEFFFLTKNGYIQKRVKRELDAYSAKAVVARANGKKGGRPPKTQQKPSGLDIGTQKKAKQEPINNNQNKEVAIAPVFNFKCALLEFGANPSDLDNWMAIRKKKKAINSEQALKVFLTEVKKARISVHDAVKKCSEKQWKGFEASWIAKEQQQKQEGFIERHADKTWADNL